MWRLLCCVMMVCLLGVEAGQARPKKKASPYEADAYERAADSVMQQVIRFAPLYERIVDSYKAELYIKGRVNIRRKNFLIRFIPSMFRLQKGVREYLMETYNELNFTAPDMYDQRVKASAGTANEFWTVDERLPEYFHVNVYSSSLLYDKLLSPLAANAPQYYTYRMDSLWHTPQGTQYRIRFIPKNKSMQLVGGYMVVTDGVWSVREMRYSGRSEIAAYSNHIYMGRVGEMDEFLPTHFDLDAAFRMVGNRVEGSYTAVLKYKEIRHRDPSSAFRKSDKSPYDLSDSYVLRCDTNAQKRDTAYFARLRPLPLTAHEDSLYRSYFLRQDTLLNPSKPRNKHLVFWGQVGDALTSRYTVNLSKVGSVRCSPLINPLLLSYSHSNGISYRQEFRYNRLFSGDRLLHVAPRIGYNFKQKEFYWSINGDFEYWPEKRAALHINLGNGNRIYSSDVLDELKAMPDSLFDFDQIHLDYFKDLYFRLRHTWEITNGLTLDVGLSIHHRTEVERSNFELVHPDFPAVQAVNAPSGSFPQYDPDFMRRFRHTYNSFAPRISLKWSPGQYYYMDGKRKVNLHSKYPTLSVDWERGVDGVLPHSSVYERWELDIQHTIPLGLMRDIYLRAGWGKFTNQKELYFVDFANFSRSNLPVGWNDEIGGVFQLLDGRWYNSSSQYLRAHATFEAPFLILPHLMKYTQYVLNERLYLGALIVPHLRPYLEVGYGIGTHIFDFGLFASFANWKYQEIGCKFTFELFNR